MPSNFFWLTENKIAGMERPGAYHPLQDDLAFLKQNRIEVVISLTLEPLRKDAAEKYGFEIFHIPVVDGSAPTFAQIEQFINYVTYALSDGKKVAVHCGAGYGRTGTMFACYLVSLGRSAVEAMTEVRKKAPLAIENLLQEARIAEFADYLNERKNG